MKRLIWVGLASIVLILFVVVAFNWRLHTRTASIAEKQLAPDFHLRDPRNKVVSLDELLKKGPAVVIFYRGSW